MGPRGDGVTAEEEADEGEERRPHDDVLGRVALRVVVVLVLNLPRTEHDALNSQWLHNGCATCRITIIIMRSRACGAGNARPAPGQSASGQTTCENAQSWTTITRNDEMAECNAAMVVEKSKATEITADLHARLVLPPRLLGHLEERAIKREEEKKFEPRRKTGKLGKGAGPAGDSAISGSQHALRQLCHKRGALRACRVE